jgi:hypothetical protein
LVAELVEVRDLELGALLDPPSLRLQVTEDQTNQRGLAGAVGTEQAELVAAQDGAGEIADQCPVIVAVANVVEFGHHFARALA